MMRDQRKNPPSAYSLPQHHLARPVLPSAIGRWAESSPWRSEISFDTVTDTFEPDESQQILDVPLEQVDLGNVFSSAFSGLKNPASQVSANPALEAIEEVGEVAEDFAF